MVDIVEIYVKDLYEKHNKREEYKGLYSIGKKVYEDDGEVDDDGFAVDKENLRILKARIDAMLLDDGNDNTSPKLKLRYFSSMT